MTKLDKTFFEREPVTVARELLGRSLVRVYEKTRFYGMIAWTAAFRGKAEKTRNYDSMKNPPGTLYIYPHRGNEFLNITTSQDEGPACIWIKQLYSPNRTPVPEFDGPGKFTAAMHIEESMDGMSVDGQGLWIEGDPATAYLVKELAKPKAGNCLGEFYIPAKGDVAQSISESEKLSRLASLPGLTKTEVSKILSATDDMKDRSFDEIMRKLRKVPRLNLGPLLLSDDSIRSYDATTLAVELANTAPEVYNNPEVVQLVTNKLRLHYESLFPEAKKDPEAEQRILEAIEKDLKEIHKKLGPE